MGCARDAVEALIERLNAMIDIGTEPSKWAAALQILECHGLRPADSESQLLVFSEFVDTARWLRGLFADHGYTTEILEGEIAPIDRDHLQQRFLERDFQVLVSTDAGGEGIDLQSAHVMLNWDIPWSLVRLSNAWAACTGSPRRPRPGLDDAFVLARLAESVARRRREGLKKATGTG
jgi:ERCC4-related helicase